MSLNTFKLFTMRRLLQVLAMTAAALTATASHAATPGIVGPTFNLTAQDAFISQPDGAMVYSWGYGCAATPAFLPTAIGGATCSSMQIPGPTLIVTEGDTVSVTLTNKLPAAAGTTSILFPGFAVTTSGGTAGVLTQEAGPPRSGTYKFYGTTSGGTAGLLTQEAAPTGSVTYTFTASTPGTHSYYSGTQGDLQVEMGLYGAIIVLPKNVPSNCNTGLAAKNLTAEAGSKESDFRLSHAAYDHPATCYDREYLFQFSEIDPKIHRQVEEQSALPCINLTGCMTVATENYHPAYFMINGRSMPDDMDPNYAPEYPHQPYNGNPHMHPGELVLLRIIGQGRWQHPFHEHGNHVRVLARDGNLILSATDPNSLGGPLLFTTTTTPGQAMDGIYYWTGKGLNWDAYGHHTGTDAADPLASLACSPDSNGYYTVNSPSPAP